MAISITKEPGYRLPGFRVVVENRIEYVGEVITVISNSYVHLKHTKKDKYVPYEFYVSATLPSRKMVPMLLEHAEESILRKLASGEFVKRYYDRDEKLKKTENKRFNKWILMDKDKVVRNGYAK